MGYINKKSSPLINLKLTDTGRLNLASGSLNFQKFGLGDSEVDYLTDDTSNSLILSPVDNNPDIVYPVASQSNEFLVPITNLNALPKEIRQSAKERGMFNSVNESNRASNSTLTTSGEWYITNVTDNVADFFLYTSGTTFTPTVGDYILVKVPYTNHLSVTSGSTWDTNNRYYKLSETVLVFSVVQVMTSLTGGFRIKVDRKLPKYPHFDKSLCIFYNGPDYIKNYLDSEPSTYWDDSVLGFELNGVTTNDDVPIWNFNLVLIDDMMGVDPTVDKNKDETKGKNLLGTSILFKNYAGGKLDKIGVIHYTNNTVSNWYGEGFYRDTFKLNLPHILWHKKQFGGPGIGNDIGYTFKSDTVLKLIDGKIRYYDLVDQEIKPTVVGKVYIDYKICVIEHPELLMAMSIKGNRNWTLPKPKLSTTEPGTCIGSSTFGALRENESLHVSYMFYDTNGVTPVNCNDYTTITSESKSLPKDVIFELPKDSNNPLYSELGYIRNYDDTTNTGFKANRVALLWQKTDAGERPNSSLWNIKDVTNYLGTTGCINQSTGIFDEFTLATETLMSPVTTHVLTQQAIGEIIVGFNGSVKLEANDVNSLSVENPFYYDKTTNTVTFHSSMPSVTQIYYLAGKTLTSYSRIQKYITPATIPSNTYTGLYTHTQTGKVSIHLDYQPSNDVVYLFYNGQLISSNNYSVYNTGLLQDRRVELNFVPAIGSNIMVYYVDAAGVGVNPMIELLTANNFNNLRVFIDQDFLDNSVDSSYNLRDIISLPGITSTGLTFGDEEFLLGNVITDIKATIYKSLMICNVLPNKFVTSTNPTWNVNQDKVQFSEIGIYDSDNDLVAIGKFSQPLKRKYNSDILVIQATIDF